MVSVESVQNAIWKAGEPVTLMREATGRLAQSVVCVAVVREYRPDELVGSLQQGDRLVLVGEAEMITAGWPIPPRRGDRMVMSDGTFTVQSVNTTRLRGAVAKHMLTVRG